MFVFLFYRFCLYVLIVLVSLGLGLLLRVWMFSLLVLVDCLLLDCLVIRFVVCRVFYVVCLFNCSVYLSWLVWFEYFGVLDV